MKLTLKDRIILPNIFPTEWKFETLIILEDIKKKLQITQKEVEEFEIKTEWQSIKWNNKWVTKQFDIEFTEIEITTLWDIFKKLSDEWKLSIDFLELYKLIVK
jgi:hypothetical protein